MISHAGKTPAVPGFRVIAEIYPLIYHRLYFLCARIYDIYMRYMQTDIFSTLVFKHCKDCIWHALVRAALRPIYLFGIASRISGIFAPYGIWLYRFSSLKSSDSISLILRP